MILLKTKLLKSGLMLHVTSAEGYRGGILKIDASLALLSKAENHGEIIMEAIMGKRFSLKKCG